MYTGRYIFSFNICSSFTSFLDAQINIPIPSINRELPAQQSNFRVSPTMTTPNRASAIGTATASVSPVDQDTRPIPSDKTSQSTPLATIPNAKLTPIPRQRAIQDISNINKNGANSIPLIVKTTATTDKES